MRYLELENSYLAQGTTRRPYWIDAPHGIFGCRLSIPYSLSKKNHKSIENLLHLTAQEYENLQFQHTTCLLYCRHQASEKTSSWARRSYNIPKHTLIVLIGYTHTLKHTTSIARLRTCCGILNILHKWLMKLRTSIWNNEFQNHSSSFEPSPSRIEQ
jgi:hypothetical protein